VKYQYGASVEVHIGVAAMEGLPCFKDVQLENPLEQGINTEAVREQEWKAQALRNIQAADTELAERLAEERRTPQR